MVAGSSEALMNASLEQCFTNGLHLLVLRVGSHPILPILETMSQFLSSLEELLVLSPTFEWVALKPTCVCVFLLEVLLIHLWSSDGQIRGGLLPDPKLRTSGYEKRVR
jgi:hypothetical protein